MNHKLSPLFLTTSFVVFSLLSSSQAMASKRLRDDDINLQDTNVTKKNAVSNVELVPINTAPQAAPCPLSFLLTPEEIKNNLHLFNQNKEESKCLARNIAFIKWVRTREFTLPGLQSPLNENIEIFTDNTAVQIDKTQAENLPNFSSIIEHNDYFIQRQIGIDITDIDFLPQELSNLASWMSSLPMHPLSNGSYQVGLLYLNYADHINKLENINRLYLSFYVYAPQDQQKRYFVVDVDQTLTWNLESFVQEAPQHYKNTIFVWQLNGEKTEALRSFNMKNEKSDDESDYSTETDDEMQQDFTAPVEHANINIAPEHMGTKIHNMADDEAANHFQHVLNSQYSSQAVKDDAAYGLAALRFQYRTQAITDDQAVQYFQQTLNNQHAPQTTKDEVARSLAVMCSHMRTKLIEP